VSDVFDLKLNTVAACSSGFVFFLHLVPSYRNLNAQRQGDTVALHLVKRDPLFHFEVMQR
jgi:hypothetical protein